MKIRKATMRDAKEITRLLNSDEGYLKIYLGDGFDLSDVRDYLNQKLNRVYVCEIDKKIAGVFIAQFWKNYIHSHLIFVDKNYQGIGIGRALMNFRDNLAMKNGKFLIESFVEEDNLKMQKILKGRDYAKGKKYICFYKKLK
ncbi:MAG: GNAT family N-acetyltransferase [Nanoarchaeota archaeon]